MGADSYVRKPFDTKELIDTINKCLKNKTIHSDSLSHLPSPKL